MATIKGILSFPALFQAKVAKGATDAKFGCTVLLAPGDPQIAMLQAEVEAAKANSFPSGYTGADECFGPYDTKYAGKEYYDPRFSGWYVFSCSAKEDDRPAVVDMSRMPVVDPAKVYSGMVAYVSAGISGYTKGKGGIGGWLNGVMITDEEAPMGRLDGKPSVDQMFAQVPGGDGAPAPTPAAPVPVPNAAPQPAKLQMTAKANGVTLEAYLATPGWTEEMLIEQGLAERVAPQPAAPAPAPTPAAPQPPVPPTPPAPAAPATLTMTAAANGMTYQQYVDAGWSDDQMIQAGVAIKPSFA
ncbi:protein of unknown function DUF2815 [Vibrio phage 1.021.C._10N.222.51.F9]|nr:protein of unknown function DUF2815 [Vibrio phage 1.021.A._10N.222.51.F9]AUR82148.1 protein of unknown function DUF2815 [Vibrio phage 1.021.B._10N.222.51.F9]AUR82198.1 protein of unknown function DUF2815 [Vibrio phage 1.021.C._10N.222.51.F9]